MVGDPAEESVYVTEQEPKVRVHLPLVGVKAPVKLDEENVTVPVGEEPVTVAVQVVDEPAETEEGVHETPVVVDPIMNDPEALPSPAQANT
jgi:hypothetical protein